jgi:SAM-dependent methyltransferase
MKDKIFLNLGCGELPIKDAANIDLCKGEYADEVVDLRVFPWPWQDESVDGIYMIHFIEHFPNATEIKIIKECHRILKKGGFLYLQVPHSSSCPMIGFISHYRTFSFNTFEEYLCRATYLYDKPLFKSELCRVIWWGLPRNKKHPYVKFNIDKPATARPFLYPFIRLLSWVIQPLIDLSPMAFERFWCYYVGGADEIVWKGIRV